MNPSRCATVLSGAQAVLALVVALSPVPSASAQAPLFKEAGSSTDRLGHSLSGVDDVDGDGVPDLLVGAPGEKGAGNGYVRILSGADGSLIQELQPSGSVYPDYFGDSVASFGDADGDGSGDYLIGEPGSSLADGAGSMWFIRGTPGTPWLVLDTFGPDPWQALGVSADAVGDVNGDGLQEIVVGAPSYSNFTAGNAFVVTPTPDPVTLDPVVYGLLGVQVGDQFGYSVAGAGDVDADGFPDIIAGAKQVPYVRIHSGATGNLIRLISATSAGFGRAVSGAGDVDGDGHADVAVGSPDAGVVDVYSGATGLSLRHFEGAAGSFGSAITDVGDNDGDGVPDLLIGAPAASVLGVSGAGSAQVISGAEGNPLFKFFGVESGAGVGTAVAAPGDLNGDGVVDLAVGAPGGAAVSASASAYTGKLGPAVAHYGAGFQGALTDSPVLELLGDPSPNGGLTLEVSTGQPSSVVVVLFGTGAGETLLPGGCTLWLAPVMPVALLLHASGRPDPGVALTKGRVPPDMPVGTVITLQAFVAAPGGAGSLSATDAVQLTIP